MEMFLWLRWVLFSCWWRTLSSVSQMGPAIHKREGIRISTQFVRVLFISLFHCVPPSEVYAFSLYRSGKQPRVWDYVFSHEQTAFHQWCDGNHGQNGLSLSILGDKYRTAEILNGCGVPMAPVLEIVRPDEEFNPSPWLRKHPRLFLKPNHGTAGRGCFVVERNGHDSGFNVFDTQKGMVTSRSTWSCLRENLSREPYMVQPLLANHPDLAVLGKTEDAITVRIITEAIKGDVVACYAAMLEIPVSLNTFISGKLPKGGHRFHVIVPIDVENGKTMKLDANQLPILALEEYKELYKNTENREVPSWNRLKRSAVNAHSRFRDIYAIAWDYVITTDGPLLLEGNPGWATLMPQIIHGGLLMGMRDLLP